LARLVEIIAKLALCSNKAISPRLDLLGINVSRCPDTISIARRFGVINVAATVVEPCTMTSPARAGSGETTMIERKRKVVRNAPHPTRYRGGPPALSRIVKRLLRA
jgi:hypothetical protein